MTDLNPFAVKCARLFFSQSGGHEVAPIREHQLVTVCDAAITLATLEALALLDDLATASKSDGPDVAAVKDGIAHAAKLLRNNLPLGKNMPKRPQGSPEFERLLTAYGDACLNAATADCTGATKKELREYQREVFASRDAIVRYWMHTRRS